MRRIISILLCVTGYVLNAATLHVPGTYATIQAAENAASAGDRIEVAAGTYNEFVTVNVNGTSDNWITFIANTNSGAVITRRWEFSSANYVRMIGFELNHEGTGATYPRSIIFVGTNSHIQIIDNYIHDTSWDALQMPSGSHTTHLTIRGNRFNQMGRTTDSGQNVIAGVYQTPRHVLVEYNHATRFVDFCDMFGQSNVFRNNWTYDVDSEYWTSVGHPDMFQPGSDGSSTGSRNHNYERNFTGWSRDSHSHFGIWQDTVNDGDTNHTIRGNVSVYGGSGVGNIGTDKHQVHSQSFAFMAEFDGSALYIAYNAGSTGGYVQNNVVHTRLSGVTAPIFVDSGHEVFTSHNWAYQAGSHSSLIGTTDPLFVDTNATVVGYADLRLTSSSPLRGVATNVVWATEGVTDTTFTVNDAQRLHDGWGIVEGDEVVIGGTTTRVVSSDWSTGEITVATSVTVTNGQPIWWGRRGDQKDIGAYPYGAEFLTAASISSVGNDYTVTTTGDARGVWFYVDGIPLHWVVDPIGGPYEQTIASGTVTAKAYALWAQPEPVLIAEAGGAPSSPANVRISGQSTFNGRATVQ